MWWALAFSALATTALSFRLLRREKRALHQPIQHNDPGAERPEEIAVPSVCPKCQHATVFPADTPGESQCWWCGEMYVPVLAEFFDTRPGVVNPNERAA